jgi:hypothetical protein
MTKNGVNCCASCPRNYFSSHNLLYVNGGAASTELVTDRGGTI